jgi:PBP1b-binding outer membrane lipoprotein LpoB
MKFTHLLAATLLASMVLVSCNKKAPENTEAKKEEITQPANNQQVLIAYACPMDCEKGKTYTEAGKCPVCKMDLTEKKSADGHSHEDGHKH